MQTLFPKRTASLTAVALLTIATVLPVRADLISLQVTGTVVSNNSSIANAAIGTPWQLTLVYDSNAPDTDPGNTAHGLYTCQSNPSILRSFAFTLDSYAVNLVNPATAATPPYIEVNNAGVNHKDFQSFLTDSAVLGTFAGVAVTNFYLSLNDDSGNGKYADDTDTLPTDLSLNETDFIINFGSINTASGIIDLGVDTITFTAVQEVPTGPPLVDTITLLIVKRLHTTKAAVTLYGTTTGPVTSVKARVGSKGAYKPATGTNAWSFRARRLKPGRNVVKVIASGSPPAPPATKKMTILRQ